MAWANSQNTVIIDRPKDVVFNTLAEELRTGFGNMSLVGADTASGLITARTGVSILSWGENITAKLTEIAPDKTLIEFKSQSTWGLVDFGRNARIIRNIVIELKRRLGLPIQ